MLHSGYKHEPREALRDVYTQRIAIFVIIACISIAAVVFTHKSARVYLELSILGRETVGTVILAAKPGRFVIPDRKVPRKLSSDKTAYVFLFDKPRAKNLQATVLISDKVVQGRSFYIFEIGDEVPLLYSRDVIYPLTVINELKAETIIFSSAVAIFLFLFASIRFQLGRLGEFRDRARYY